MPLSRVFKEPFNESWDLERKVDWLAHGMLAFRDAVNDVVRTTNTKIQRTSLRVALLSVVVLLDVLSTAGFALVLTGAQSACNQSNAARAADRSLWKHVVDLSPKPTTPEQEQITKQFLVYVDQQFHPLNCSLTHQL